MVFNIIPVTTFFCFSHLQVLLYVSFREVRICGVRSDSSFSARHINCARYSHFWVFDSYGNKPPGGGKRRFGRFKVECISCENHHFDHFVFGDDFEVPCEFFQGVVFVPEWEMREKHSKFWISPFGGESGFVRHTKIYFFVKMLHLSNIYLHLA